MRHHHQGFRGLRHRGETICAPRACNFKWLPALSHEPSPLPDTPKFIFEGQAKGASACRSKNCCTRASPGPPGRMGREPASAGAPAPLGDVPKSSQPRQKGTKPKFTTPLFRQGAVAGRPHHPLVVFPFDANPMCKERNLHRRQYYRLLPPEGDLLFPEPTGTGTLQGGRRDSSTLTHRVFRAFPRGERGSNDPKAVRGRNSLAVWRPK